MSYQLLQGDCLEVMRTLPANSVQCCVTSPPYFGLRDYGTAEWEGGDAACDHKPVSDNSKQASTSTLGGSKRNVGNALTGYGDICGKCGARRIDRQIGLEETPEAYVAKLVEVFREVRRLLHPTGVLFLNLGDGWQDKQLLGIPWRVAFALQGDGWILRSEIIWAKKAPMPESVTDRPTKAHEQVFLLAKSASYYYDAEAIAEPTTGDSGWEKQRRNGNGFPIGGNRPDASLLRNDIGRTGEPSSTRNKRSVWTLGPEQFNEAHFATMPTKLVEPCILAGTSAKGCCSVCGAPWERVVERETRAGTGAYDAVTEPAVVGTKVNGTALRGNPGKNLGVLAKETTGWQPTCTCNADVVPCTVLDPFNGSGTTGAVALKHHRAYVGIDLNPAYLELAQDRIRRSQPTLLEVTA